MKSFRGQLTTHTVKHNGRVNPTTLFFVYRITILDMQPLTIDCHYLDSYGRKGNRAQGSSDSLRFVQRSRNQYLRLR